MRPCDKRGRANTAAPAREHTSVLVGAEAAQIDTHSAKADVQSAKADVHAAEERVQAAEERVQAAKADVQAAEARYISATERGDTILIESAKKGLQSSQTVVDAARRLLVRCYEPQSSDVGEAAIFSRRRAADCLSSSNRARRLCSSVGSL